MRFTLWLLGTTLILGTTFAAGWAQAQGGATPPNAVVPIPKVLRGNDIGFRVEGQSGDRVKGRLVLWNGTRWVDTEFVVAPRLAQ
jgi:hypothetical protein